MYKKILTIFVLLSVALMGVAFAAPAEDQGLGEGPLVTMENSNGSGQQTQDQIKEQTQARVQDGEHLGEGGQMMKVQTQANNQMKLEVGGVAANSNLELKQDLVEGKTKLSVTLSNGQDTEVKVMPNTASETALDKLKLNNCVEAEGCSIELKEVGSGDKTKAAYELKTQRQSKVLGLFKAKMQVEAQVDAENGEVLKVKKPWWAFIASEPQEE